MGFIHTIGSIPAAWACITCALPISSPSDVIKEFNITPQNISGRDVNIRGTFYYYDGTPKCPAVTIDGLVENMDFTVSYDNNLNAGIAKAVVQGIGNYTGNREVTFTIGQSPLPSASIELEYIKTTYTGSELCPKVTIGNLIENVDFNVKARNLSI